MKKLGRLVSASDPESFLDLSRLECPPSNSDEIEWFIELTRTIAKLLNNQYPDIYWYPVHPKIHAHAVWLNISGIRRDHLPEGPTNGTPPGWTRDKIGMIDIKIEFDWPEVRVIEAVYADYAQFTLKDTNIIELQLMAEKLVNIMRNPEMRQPI